MSPILMLTADTSTTFTATVVIAGVTIVMAVLLLLIFVFQLFGLSVSRAEAAVQKKKKASKNNSEADIIPAPAPVARQAKAPLPQVSSAGAEYDGVNGEIVAVITAAIEAAHGGTAVIRSIKRKEVQGRNPWAQAAKADNTRPFNGKENGYIWKYCRASGK